MSTLSIGPSPERIPNIILVCFAAGLILSTTFFLKIGNFFSVGVAFLLVACFWTYRDIFRKKAVYSSEFTKIFWLFWLMSFSLLGIGSFYSFSELSNPNFSFHTLFAYLLVLLCIGGYLAHQHLVLSTETVFKLIVSITMWYYTFIIAITALGLSPVDAPIYQPNTNRLILWSDNPNKVAFILTPFPFLAWHWALTSRAKTRKFYYCLLGLMAIAFGLQTKTEALTAGWACVMAMLFATKKIPIFSARNSKIFKALIILIALFWTPQIWSKLETVYDAGGQGSERIDLLRNGVLSIASSPIFGFGPGEYSGMTGPFLEREAHNLLIDWLMGSGLVGLLLLLSLLIWTVFRSRRNLLFCSALLAIYVFSSFHFFTRHPIWWFYVMGLVVISSQNYASNLSLQHATAKKLNQYA